MLGKIANFEFRYQLTSPAFFIIFLLFFLFTFAGVALPQVQIGTGGNVNVNSPYGLILTILIMGLFAIIIPTVFLSNVVLRDSANKMDGILFSTPVTKTDYLVGRFLGGFAIVILAYLSIPLGFFVGTLMPWLDPELVGPLRPLDYLYVIGLFGIPNMLLVGMLMFVVANLTRSNMATYIALVGFFVFYLVSQSFLDQPEFRSIAALTDPVGATAFDNMTRNWTAFERNAQLPPISGDILKNRLLWIGVSIGLMVLNFVTFSFRRTGASISGRKKTEKTPPQQRFIPTEITLPAVTREFTAHTSRRQFFARTAFEVRSIFFSITFWVLLVLGIALALLNLFNIGEIFGTPILPVTRTMVDLLVGGFGFVPFVVVIFYAADLLWRDRGAKMHEIIDASPAPGWAFLLPKLLAISLVVIALFAFAIVTGILFQIMSGYNTIELSQYVIRMLYITAWPLILIGVLAMFFQIVLNNRYLGLLAMLVFYIGVISLSNIGFEHNLYQYAQTPNGAYSDMNGYGHFLGIRSWFNLYWTFVALVLLVLSYGLWTRGALTPFFRRVADLPKTLNSASWGVLSVGLVGAIATGGYIFYNTNILNEYVTSKSIEKIAVDYEEKYSQYEGRLQPKITDVSVNVDIFPADRRVDVRGTYEIQNKTSEPLSLVHVEYSDDLTIKSQSLEGADIEMSDDVHNVYFFKTQTPLMPGEALTLSFNTEIDYVGFRNGRNGVTVIENGTFLNNLDIMPGLGYFRARILQDRSLRRRYDLEPVDRQAKLEDESQYTTNYLRGDSDFVSFEATVSTSPDQIAIAPGYLTREWTENDRRYFHYKMDTPILNFFSFQSARYTVREDKWNDVDIQIFYHKPHDYNVDRMIDSTKKSLSYFTKNFSPFQYRQLRILEFPYRGFAQSFPNTVPFSENIGFIADNSDPDDVDSTFYVTSHEVAHQWWAHQVMGADVQGGTMLVETFAQYSAFMTVEKEFGEEHVRKFLQRELESYLESRGTERVGELPLYRDEGQGYIHYRKGSLVMYALKDYVGEAVVNRSLQRLIKLRGFKSDPYAISTDFLTILREEAGSEFDNLITDLFEKITIFDLEAQDAEVTERDDGKFDVTFTYTAEKFHADGEGRETPAPILIPIDIGIFDKSPADSDFGESDVLYLEKHVITPDNPVVTITVDERPGFAGIDPYIKLIDRDAENNLVSVN